jgi:hypothetical protein
MQMVTAFPVFDLSNVVKDLPFSKSECYTSGCIVAGALSMVLALKAL